MAIKNYPSYDDRSPVANEPAVAYQASSPVERLYQVTDRERENIMRAKEQYARGEYIVQEEMDKMVKEWLV